MHVILIYRPLYTTCTQKERERESPDERHEQATSGGSAFLADAHTHSVVNANLCLACIQWTHATNTHIHIASDKQMENRLKVLDKKSNPMSFFLSILFSYKRQPSRHVCRCWCWCCGHHHLHKALSSHWAACAAIACSRMEFDVDECWWASSQSLSLDCVGFVLFSGTHIARPFKNVCGTARHRREKPRGNNGMEKKP